MDSILRREMSLCGMLKEKEMKESVMIHGIGSIYSFKLSKGVF